MEFRVPLIVKKDLIFDFFTDPLEDEFQDVIEKSDYHLISHVKCQNLGLLVDGFEVDSTLKLEKYINVIYQKILSKMLKQDICIGFILGKSYKSKKFESKKYSLNI